MQGYGQYCPVALSSEIFAERWTPLVIRNLFCGATTFNEIQRGVPLMSRSLLSKRLKELEKAGILERRRGARGPEYVLTQAGEELRPLIDQLGIWGQRWARAVRDPGPLDPGLLMWDMRRRINLDKLPERRVVVRYDFTDVKRGFKRTWMLLERSGVDACVKDPGFEVDLVVTGPLRTLTAAWMGDVALPAVLRSGQIVVEGRRELVSAFPGWLALSPFADVDRAGAAPLPQPR